MDGRTPVKAGSGIGIFHRGQTRVNEVTFRHGQLEITASKGVNYLGIWLDGNLSFETDVKKAKIGAER